MWKSSRVRVVEGKRLNMDADTLPTCISPSTYSAAILFTILVGTLLDNMISVMVSRPKSMPMIQSNILIVILKICFMRIYCFNYHTNITHYCL